jgi:cation diffusion facilitator family transporter
MADHDHDHPHDHDHNDHDHAGHEHHDNHNHDHDHEHGEGFWATLREAIPFFHGHSHGEVNIDNALEASERGIWALKISLAILAVTALIQIGIFMISGSAGLLADTIHNFSDALTAIPLGLAFLLARRVATRRYTYGYGRAEDIAGTIIVLMILASALIAGYESYQKLVNPQPLQNVGWVMVAAVVGFVGNEAVAIFRIRVGREIGSAALMADGEHARIDGFTSLAVFFGALGSALGFPIADPIVGLLITIAILFIVKDTVVQMWHRLMDAVDPKIVDIIEKTAVAVPGTQNVNSIRVRWLGHNLEAEMHIVVDEDLSTRDSHHIAEEVRHALFHAQPRLATVNIHVDPCGHGGDDPHEMNAHHASQVKAKSS